MLRNDVHDRRARDLGRMVEAHAVQHAGAAVVAGGEEFIVTERGHDLDLVLRHGAKRIAGMVVAARRLFGIAVAAQIGQDHAELLDQRRRHLGPVQMGEWIAVHQQQRRPAAAGQRNDARARGLNIGAGKAVEHENPLLLIAAAMPRLIVPHHNMA
jgi:hypothetical protein